jgi:hypothetical protein
MTICLISGASEADVKGIVVAVPASRINAIASNRVFSNFPALTQNRENRLLRDTAGTITFLLLVRATACVRTLECMPIRTRKTHFAVKSLYASSGGASVGDSPSCMPMMTPILVLASGFIDIPTRRVERSDAMYWVWISCRSSLDDSAPGINLTPHREQNRVLTKSILKHPGHWMRFLLSSVILSRTDLRQFFFSLAFASRSFDVGPAV